MAQPFRFYRGELNGFYVLAILLSHNDAVSAILAELAYQALMSFAIGTDVPEGRVEIRDADLSGLARFSGVLHPAEYGQENQGSIVFTDSHVVDGVQYSERGLYNMLSKNIEFVRDDAGVYGTDIATLASSNLRMSFVPPGTAPVGYLPLGVELFDSDGNIIPGALLLAPPANGHYEEYYGPNFLTLENVFTSSAGNMTTDIFMNYYESIRQLRRDGPSLDKLLSLTEIICQGYVCNLELVATSYYYTLYYDINTGVDLPNPTGAFNAWIDVLSKRFKNVIVELRP